MLQGDISDKIIQGWASHGKDQPLVKFSYKPAELLANDVEIKISHCGICGSDIHTLDSGWGATDYPVIVGHEIVGTIVGLGDAVTHLNIGDRVGVGAQCGACLNDDCYACSRKKDAHCPKAIYTYNSRRSFDEAKSYGGYAEAIRVQSQHAFKIPDSIPSDLAAPLLCAGSTVFSPMLRYKFSPGDKVGVAGIGGLGHLAIKFAAALGCHVTALSNSPSKKLEVLKMGANVFVDTNQPEEVDKIHNTLNYLIVTSNFEPSSFQNFADVMDIEGRIILLAIPEFNLDFSPFMLILKNISISGSLIGSIAEIKAMLDFAAKHKVHPIIEIFKMEHVNQAIQRVRDGKVRYRVVLEN